MCCEWVEGGAHETEHSTLLPRWDCHDHHVYCLPRLTPQCSILLYIKTPKLIFWFNLKDSNHCKVPLPLDRNRFIGFFIHRAAIPHSWSFLTMVAMPTRDQSTGGRSFSSKHSSFPLPKRFCQHCIKKHRNWVIMNSNIDLQSQWSSESSNTLM